MTNDMDGVHVLLKDLNLVGNEELKTSKIINF